MGEWEVGLFYHLERKGIGGGVAVMKGIQNFKEWLKTVFKELPLLGSSRFILDCQL